MKEYKLKQWYPSLPTEWIWCDEEKHFEFPIIVVKREDGYHLHPSLKGMTRFAIIPEREVDRNEEFWEEVSAEKPKPKNKQLEFARWLLEEFTTNNTGNYYLGDGKYRYNYLSPYSIEELFDIFSAKKKKTDDKIHTLQKERKV